MGRKIRAPLFRRCEKGFRYNPLTNRSQTVQSNPINISIINRIKNIHLANNINKNKSAVSGIQPTLAPASLSVFFSLKCCSLFCLLNSTLPLSVTPGSNADLKEEHLSLHAVSTCPSD